MPLRDFGRVHAPDFPAGRDFIGTEPFRLQDLRGRIVVLDFWTYG